MHQKLRLGHSFKLCSAFMLCLATSSSHRCKFETFLSAVLGLLLTIPCCLLPPQHGGSTNAFTASEFTNYYFDVNSDAFEEALDRLMAVAYFLTYNAANCHTYNSPPQEKNPCHVQTDCFLFRFAQFFIKPLMSPDATMREIKAVDSGIADQMLLYFSLSIILIYSCPVVQHLLSTF